MGDNLLTVARIAAVLGCGVMTGIFFAFSTAVMPGLARLEPSQAMQAMQAMNRSIVNPLFLLFFLGSPVFCLLVILGSVSRLPASEAISLIAGAGLYLIGALLVTVVFNVPMNNNLDAVSPTSPDAARQWATYLSVWTNWNHVRSVTSLLATALLLLGR